MIENHRGLLFYPPVVEYLSRKNKTIRNDYRMIVGNFSENCDLMAADIARLFLEGGIRPFVLIIRREILSNDEDRNLIPKVYEGRVKWGEHLVCAYGDMVYDPIVGIPITKIQYSTDIFNHSILIEEYASEDNIEEFIQEAEARCRI